MQKVIFLVKKALRFILWLLVGYVVLLLIIIVLLQISVIQSNIIQYATSFVSGKTHTKVSIKKIKISFPKSLVIEGLYLEDTKKDTLLYAGKVVVNLAFRDLFNQQIHISSFNLEDVVLHLNTSKTDSLFNYNFLIAAFSDTTKLDVKKPVTKSKWTFGLDNVTLKNIHLQYFDNYGGTIVTAVLYKLAVTIDKLDLEKSQYAINDLFVEGLNTSVLIQEGKSQSDTSKTLLPFVTIQKVHILKMNFRYNDSIAHQSAIIACTELGLKNTLVDLQNQKFSLQDFYLIKSNFQVNTINENIFSIDSLRTDFKMDKHSISAKKLKIKTSNSAIDADVAIGFSSLQSLQDSLQSMGLNVTLRNASIKNSDILYFNPALRKQAFFKHANTITTIKGTVTGFVNNLDGKNLQLTTGTKTILETDCRIVELPSIESAIFDFSNLAIKTSKKDILMFADTLVPKSIALPENLSLHIAFKGSIKSFATTLALNSSFGSAKAFANIDKYENFRAKVSLNSFDLGRLLKDTALFGLTSLVAETDGHGFDKKTVMANVKADVTTIYLNKYNYKNLTIDGSIAGQEFKGKVKLDDENAKLDFDGMVNLNPDQQKYSFRLNVDGADLQKLHFTNNDIRIALVAKSEIVGATAKDLNGNATFSNIKIAHKDKSYNLDSIQISSINKPNESSLYIASSIINLQYNGTSFPSELPQVLGEFVNSYFPFLDSIATKQSKEKQLQNFTFDIQLHNHPILSEVFLPELKAFESGEIHGSFSSEKNDLKLLASIKNIEYGSTVINDLAMNVKSDVDAISYSISSAAISNAQLKLDNVLLEGTIAEKRITAKLSSIDENQKKKLVILSEITKDADSYKLKLDPKEFYLMNYRWDIAADNYLKFGKQGFLIHHLSFNKAETELAISSVHDKFNDDLNIAIHHFNLADISGIIEKDTALVGGNIDGNILLKQSKNGYGILADAKINNLVVREVPIGNVTLKAENPSTEKFTIAVGVSGADNNLTADGYFISKANDNSVNMKAAIQSLSMKTVQAFSLGAISDASGTITGDFLIDGKATAPDITGNVTFNDAIVTPAALNNPLHIKHETLQLKKDGIYFNAFTILDANQHSAIIDGNVQMKDFKDFVLALKISSKDFLLFNTTAKDNKEFYGKMIIDSKIAITGPLSLPVINAKVKLKKGSNITVAVPENKLTNDRGENVVEFESSAKRNAILDSKPEKQQSSLTGFDISSIIEIDKEATLRLLMDPTSSDSLVVKGDAALSFAIDRSGTMSLTGAYNVNEGNYVVSLESVIKRKFSIQPQSTINWNGDPLDADVSINAIYSVRTSPIDLMVNQLSDLSEADKNTYKQRYPFIVLLKLRGALLKPEISFEIQLMPEDKGILNGSVNAKLSMLNEDPSALNKQVFALLVLGRFIQENPLQTESSATSTAVRSTVGNLLSAQLNQLSSKVIKGVELNFDIESYNDYQSGQAVGRSQVDVGVKKQLFNDRLTVEVGGTVDVEGEKAKQNSASDIASDFTVEYKITNNGRYRLKGFRHNQYEGAIEGQLVETGIGFVFVRDFNYWRSFFKSKKMRINAVGKEKN